MNVLHLGCPYFPYVGGSSQRLRKLVEGYAHLEHVVLSLATPSAGEVTDDYPFENVYRSKSLNGLGYSLLLHRFLIKVRPDIVVVHNSRALLKWVLWYSYFFRDVKIVYEVHSLRSVSGIKEYVNRLIFKKVDGFVVLSKSSADVMRSRYNVSCCRVVYSGLEHVDGEHRSRPYDPSSVTFAYIGSFHEWQGVQLIAGAARLLGEAFWDRHKLLLIGGGPALEATLSLLGEELVSHKNIQLLGWLSKEEIRSIIGDVDYLLAPRPSTLATETVVPLKVVESIQYGVPLIATKVGGLYEILGPDSLAVFISGFTADSLAKSMRQPLIGSDYEDLRSSLLNKRFSLDSWESSAREYVDYLFMIASRK